jgi:tetratricopeptide (TPR) repeat protein
VASDPRLGEGWDRLGRIAERRGDLAQARQLYDKAIPLLVRPAETVHNLAVLLQRLGEIDAANLGAAAGKGRNNEAHRPRSSANSTPTAPARQPALVHFLN